MADYYGLDAFRAALEADGWRIGIDGLRREFSECNWYAWHSKRIDGPGCACNDKPPSLMVWPSQYTAPTGMVHTGCELEVCGEAASGHWLKLRVYTLPADAGFFDALPVASAQLVAAWRVASVMGAVETAKG